VCLILVALGAHERYPFVLAANRDEFHHRATAAAGHWSDAPSVFGGRDLEKGGSWLALSQRGALAAVTNYRDPSRKFAAPQSRGLLVSSFVRDTESAQDFVAGALARGDQYDGFSLLAADAGGVWYGSNRGGDALRLDRGLHGLSNHLLDTPWPKVRRAKTALAAALQLDGPELIDALFALLADDTQAAHDELPATGLSLDWERQLSPVFIRMDGYGTRASTVVLVDRNGEARFMERSFDAAGRTPADRSAILSLEAPIAQRA
jgi:uncharacterized protein with NRDE domain